MKLLAIDPGLNHCGVAVWNFQTVTPAATLVSAYLVRSAAPKDADPGERWRGMSSALDKACREDFHTLVIERPKVYTYFKSKADPDDLLQLTGVVGCLIATIKPKVIVTYLPRQWKGAADKDVTKARCEAVLTTEELKRVFATPPSLGHNVWDAVGIGAYHLEKIGARKFELPKWTP